MSASQPSNFNLQEFSDAGLLLVGGRLYTYTYGTTTLKIAYTDSAGTVPHTYTSDGLGGQYIALNARGELPAPLYLTLGTYDLTLKRSDGSTVWTRPAEPSADSVAALSASTGAARVGLAQGGTVQDAIKYVTPEMFSGATDLIRLTAAASYAEANNVYMQVNDHATHYDLGGGNLLLPRLFRGITRTDSDVRGFLFQNGTVTLRTKSHPKVEGVDASTFRCEGLQKGYVHNARCTTFVVDGYSVSWGVFWVDFADITTGKCTLDLTTFAINANSFRNVVAGTSTDYGIDINDGTNAGPTYYECHGNIFELCDTAHSRGVINRSSLNQTNYIVGGYSEDITAGYKAVTGNFEISGMNSDGGGVPSVGILNHVFGMTRQIERTGGDVLSLSDKSLIPLDWSVLDSTGKPPAISGGSVVVDAAMPGGSGARYGASTGVAFSNITVAFPKVIADDVYPRFTMSGFWYGDLPATIEVATSAGTKSYGNEGFVDLGGSYYFFRLTGYGDSTVAWSLKFFITVSATVRQGYLGACFVSPYKAAVIPYRQPLGSNVVTWYDNGLMHQKASVSQGYTAASPVTIAITFPKPYTSASSVVPVYSVNPAATFAGKMTKHEIVPDSITTTGFSVQVYFTPDWTGTINYYASGV